MTPYRTLLGCEPGNRGGVVVLGAPYDRGSSSEASGCAGAPARLRALSAPEDLQMRRHGLFDRRGRRLVAPEAVTDLGDVPFRASQTDDAYLEFLAHAVRLIATEKKRPLLLGGDHLVTLAALRGLNRAGIRPQLVQLDAHTDAGFVEPGDRPTHSTFINHVVREGLVSQVLQVGIRGVFGAPLELPESVRIVDGSELASALTSAPVYLTVDTDAFDPAIAPGVSFPEPGGLTLASLIEVLTAVREHGGPAVGADWVEFNPRFDTHHGMTGRFVICGLALLLETLSLSDRTR